MDKKYLINCSICEKELEINKDLRESINIWQAGGTHCMVCQEDLLGKLKSFLSLEVENTKMSTDDEGLPF